MNEKVCLKQTLLEKLWIIFGYIKCGTSNWKNISTHKERNKQLNTIEKDLF